MSTSPTFVATFADDEVTRMSVFTLREKLDMARGVRLARAAYESRMKQAAPPIIEAHYERNGEVLKSYERKQLDGECAASIPAPANNEDAAHEMGLGS
jgi:hypothetical protein